MADFRCGNCNYVFKKEEKPSKCPYCDTSGNLMDNSSVVSSLDKINDI